MAIPTEVEASIRNLFIPKLVDQVFHQTYLLETLWKKHQVQEGGTGFEQPVEYEKNPNVGTYRKYGIFRREPQELITKSVVSWADYYIAIPFSRKELRENKGAQGVVKLIDLAATRIRNSEKSIKDRLCTDLYSDGSAYEWPAGSGETLDPLTGLGSIVDQDRTYGGIDSTTYTWWDCQKPHTCDGSVVWEDLFTAGDADYLPIIADTMFAETDDGSDMVDLILCDPVTWDAWHQIFHGKESIMRTERIGRGKAKPGQKGYLGFEALMYRERAIVGDRFCPAGSMYFLNTDHLYMRALAGADMTYEPPERVTGEDTELATILLSTNINCDACRRQGVVTGLPTTRTQA